MELLLCCSQHWKQIKKRIEILPVTQDDTQTSQFSLQLLSRWELVPSKVCVSSRVIGTQFREGDVKLMCCTHYFSIVWAAQIKFYWTPTQGSWQLCSCNAFVKEGFDCKWPLRQGRWIKSKVYLTIEAAPGYQPSSYKANKLAAPRKTNGSKNRADREQAQRLIRLVKLWIFPHDKVYSTRGCIKSDTFLIAPK